MVPPKICMMCRQRIIQSWESVCSSCWKKVIEHDLCPVCHGEKNIPFTNYDVGITVMLNCPKCNGTGYTGDWRINLILLNYAREFLRECGVDITEMDRLW